jgi:hypothetical protein
MYTYKVYIEDADGSERLGCTVQTSSKFAARKLAVARLGKKIKITSIEQQ